MDWWPIVLLDLPATPPVSLSANTLADRYYYPLLMLQGTAWIYTYAVLIHRGYADKYLGIPVIAVALNLSWEMTYGFFLPHPPSQKFIDLAWVALDLVILRQAFRFGHKDFPHLSRRTFVWSLWGLVLWGLVFQIALGYELADFEGIYGALGINVVMSIAFIYMLRQRGSSIGQSMHIAVPKCIGTFTAGLLFFFFYPERWLLTLLTLTILLIDITYIRMLARQIRTEGRSLWKLNLRPTPPSTAEPSPERTLSNTTGDSRA